MKIGRWSRFLPLATSLFLSSSWLPPAAAQSLGAEFQANSYTTGYQWYPVVAGDDAGNFLVVWSSSDQDGDSYGVFGQRFDSMGHDLGSEFQVNAYTTGVQGYRSLAAAGSGSGNFIVVWGSQGQDGSFDGVLGRRYDSAGNPMGSEFQINTFTTNYQEAPAVAADSLGNFVVVWASPQDGSVYGVVGQRFDSNGDPVESEFQVNSHTPDRQHSPSVAMTATGEFVVAWESKAQDGDSYGVFGQRFDSNGDPVGSEFRVNSFTTGDQDAPSLAIDNAGNFVVVWRSGGQDTSGEGVFGQRFDSIGNPAGSEFQVNSWITASQTAPSVAADGAGNFLVVWYSFSQDGSNTGVFGQRYDPDGDRVASEFQLNTYTTSHQYDPSVTSNGAGDFVAVWTSNGQDGDSYAVIGKQLTGTLFSDDFESGAVCAWSTTVGDGDGCVP